MDAQTPDRVAVLRGAQVLFGFASQPPQITGAKSLGLQINRQESHWNYQQEKKAVPLWSFCQIKDEIFQIYWNTQA